MQDAKNKLVSVVIVAYNAADSIADTLDSIYQQTYPEIELVVADDASKDDTVAVAQAWIDAHRERFTDCILIAHEKNQGVAENLNSGIRAATGAYIKDFGADDRLQPTYLEVHVAYLQENGVDCVCSNMRAYHLEDGQPVYEDYAPPAGADFFEADAQTQYRMLLQGNRVYSPTFLATRALYDRHGLYDPRFPLMEDYPYYLKLTKEGTKHNYLDVCLVDYCFSETSISNATSTRVLSPNFHKMMRSFFYKERLGGLWKTRNFKFILLNFWQLFFGDCVLLFGNKSKNPIVRFCDNMRNLRMGKHAKK